MAVAAAPRQCRAGRLTDTITVMEGTLPLPAPSPTYDVVLANITAQSLITLSPRLPAVLAPRGRLLACGIIDAKADEALAAFEAKGLHLLDRKEAGDWVLLAMGAR